MLHGIGGHAEAFHRNVVPLGEHYHVYALDMAGHGYTDPHPDQPGLAGMADHLLRSSEEVRVHRDEPVDVVDVPLEQGHEHWF